MLEYIRSGTRIVVVVVVVVVLVASSSTRGRASTMVAKSLV